jgi:hypothetical protein
MNKLTLLTLTLGLAAGSAQAAVIGTQGFADIGTPTADGGSTGDINTATAFTIGNLVSTSSNTGDFAGLPSQVFGAVNFNTGDATSLTFGNSVFGTFTSTSIVEEINTPGTVGFYVLGDWTPGSYGSVSGGPFDSSFTISFTQTPAHAGSLSDSATFSNPPAGPVGSVPETSTLAMMLLGFAGLGFAGYRASRNGAALAA